LLNERLEQFLAACSACGNTGSGYCRAASRKHIAEQARLLAGDAPGGVLGSIALSNGRFERRQLRLLLAERAH